MHICGNVCLAFSVCVHVCVFVALLIVCMATQFQCCGWAQGCPWLSLLISCRSVRKPCRGQRTSSEEMEEPWCWVTAFSTEWPLAPLSHYGEPGPQVPYNGMKNKDVQYVQYPHAPTSPHTHAEEHTWRCCVIWIHTCKYVCIYAEIYSQKCTGGHKWMCSLCNHPQECTHWPTPTVLHAHTQTIILSSCYWYSSQLWPSCSYKSS